MISCGSRTNHGPKEERGQSAEACPSLRFPATPRAPPPSPPTPGKLNLPNLLYLQMRIKKKEFQDPLLYVLAGD